MSEQHKHEQQHEQQHEAAQPPERCAQPTALRRASPNARHTHRAARAYFASHAPPNPVQLKGNSADNARAVHEAAQQGVSGAGGDLPFIDRIQKAFGRHSLAGVKAHTGVDACEASARIGARAYATGRDVAFGEQPNLHTAAHEAAHVVQQRSGKVSLPGGVSSPGDPHERHADAVADAVVQGKSAEGLLDAYTGDAPRSALQRVASSSLVQREETPKADTATANSDDGDGAKAEADQGAEETAEVTWHVGYTDVYSDRLNARERRGQDGLMIESFNASDAAGGSRLSAQGHNLRSSGAVKVGVQKDHPVNTGGNVDGAFGFSSPGPIKLEVHSVVRDPANKLARLQAEQFGRDELQRLLADNASWADIQLAKERLLTHLHAEYPGLKFTVRGLNAREPRAKTTHTAQSAYPAVSSAGPVMLTAEVQVPEREKHISVTRHGGADTTETTGELKQEETSTETTNERSKKLTETQEAELQSAASFLAGLGYEAVKQSIDHQKVYGEFGGTHGRSGEGRFDVGGAVEAGLKEMKLKSIPGSLGFKGNAAFGSTITSMFSINGQVGGELFWQEMESKKHTIQAEISRNVSQRLRAASAREDLWRASTKEHGKETDKDTRDVAVTTYGKTIVVDSKPTFRPPTLKIRSGR